MLKADGDIDVYLPIQTSYLGKFFFWSCGWKDYQPTILQDSSIRCISRWNQLNSFIICTWMENPKRKTFNLFFIRCGQAYPGKAKAACELKIGFGYN